MADDVKNMLLQVRNLTKHYPVYQSGLLRKAVGAIQAVDQVRFHVEKGETLGLVGESGCGKTTCGRMVLGLEKPTDGSVVFDGRELSKLSKQEMRGMRKQLQMIFQDPFGSLNPRMTVRQIVGELLEIHGLTKSRQEWVAQTDQLLEMVGLDPAMAGRYPHAFSGGQRQRIGIARAISVRPELIVCDEPVSALDVSIQAQILNLLQELKKRFGLAYLFIAHDLAVVRHLSDRIAVMYLGKIVEIGRQDDLVDNPMHPYTRALLAAVPIPDPEMEKRRKAVPVIGEVPSPLDPPAGCRFHPRCPEAVACCRKEPPFPGTTRENGHWAACHRVS